MKSMKKLVTLLLSLVMLCALALPAMAEDKNDYSITINGAVAGHTYTAYQVFKGVYYSGKRQVKEQEAEYLSDVEWGEGVEGAAIVTELKADTTLEALRNRFATVKENDADAAEKVAYILQGLGDKSEELDEFARVVGKHLTATKAGKTVEVAAGATNAKIDKLPAGYYFVKDSGKIADGEIATKFLVEVVGNANVTVKDQAPTIDKKIVDNNKDTNRTSVNIGDQVEFKLTATVPDMANFDTYTFTISDTLSEGLTFDEDTVEVKIDGTKLEADTNYTLISPTAPQTDNTFKIEFTKAQLGDKVKYNTGATIVVTYKATLNSNALTTDKETNTAKLEYSNNPSSSTDKGTITTPDVPTYIYNFNIDVDKYDGTDGTATGKKLEKAVFVLYRLNGKTKEYYKCDGTDKKVTWVDGNNNATPKTTDVHGKATFEGLKEGTYYLEEITAPDGYNKLKDPVAVEIKATYNDNGTLNTTAADCKLKHDADGKHYYQVQSIANKAGAVLPSTGGIGTTIFYVLGSILALGAAVLLIAKKRMNGQDR